MTSDAIDLPGERPEALELPGRAVFWQWVWSAVRPVVGWLLAALGLLSLLLGWLGVSREPITAKQLPYLVSGGLTGVALVILAAVFLATDDVRRQLRQVGALERRIDALCALLLENPAADAGPLVALPTGTAYHLPTCPLVVGKDNVVDAASVTARRLAPCRVCEPPARHT